MRMGIGLGTRLRLIRHSTNDVKWDVVSVCALTIGPKVAYQ